MNAMMLQVRNYKSLLLAALLVGAVSTASAGTPCGNNLEWVLNGSTLVLSSPNPYSAATIYAQAFRNKGNFTDVIIPDNVTQIHTKAFENCTALTNVVIPASVDSIGVEAFKGCSALSDVLCRRYYAPKLGTDAFTNCHASLKICGWNEKKLRSILEKEKTKLQDVFIMTADSSGKYRIVRKEKNRHV